jgi:2-C-methyl-D-erythritol 4-phosphate cytidylyltransferase
VTAGAEADADADAGGRGAGPVWAVVLAGGSGTRFGGPKHLEVLGGRRLVDRAVDLVAADSDGVVVVLPAGTRWDGPPVQAAVPGGATRSGSVRAGLAAVPHEAAVVVIHDAAHPVAARRLFPEVIAAVRAGADGALPVLPANETVLHLTDGRVVGAESVPLAFAQMPHAFAAGVLRAAHLDGPEAKDDVSLLVSRGAHVATVPGDPGNVHITTPAELALAARLLGDPVR